MLESSISAIYFKERVLLRWLLSFCFFVLLFYCRSFEFRSALRNFQNKIRMYDVLIIGAGAAGMSCALILGSAKSKAFAKDRRIGLIAHQRTSHLQTALFNNVLGFTSGTLGADILKQGSDQLTELYPHVDQIKNEKVKAILRIVDGFKVTT